MRAAVFLTLLATFCVSFSTTSAQVPSDPIFVEEESDGPEIRAEADKHRKELADAERKSFEKKRQGIIDAQKSNKNLAGLTGIERINKILDGPTAQWFIETPIEEAMDEISKMHGIQILVDFVALDEMGWGDDMTVSVQLSDISLRSCLNAMLRDKELTHRVADEVLTITSTVNAEDNAELRMHSLPEMLQTNGELVTILQDTVDSDLWTQYGGNSTAMKLNDVLIVCTTNRVQKKVEDFVRKLSKSLELEEQNRQVIRIELEGPTAENADRIRKALAAKVTHCFIETPLMEVVREISETQGIPIRLEHQALSDVGLDSDTGVTIEVKEVSLRSLLRLALRDLDLTYLVQDEILTITTHYEAEERIMVEMYQLPKRLSNSSEQLIEAIQESVVPDAWSLYGGTSTLHSSDDVLIVATTSDVHHQVERFLNELMKKTAAAPMISE